MTLAAIARARTGLTQAAFAERVGTSRPRLSAYENGRTDPELDTLLRIATAADLELDLVPRGTASIRRQCDAIRRALAESDRAWALRLVAEVVAWVRTDVVSIDALDQDPGLVGDRGWDALLGGVAEMLCHERQHRIPAWASAPSRFAEELWFYSARRSLWPYIVVTTPAALAARGVFLSADSLESV